jgi:hypothetical protein
VVTDGAFSLLNAERKAWQLIPLPASRPFRAEIRLAALGKKGARVRSVERLEPFTAFAKAPEWRQDGAALHFACDGRAFAYRILFE